MLGRANSGTEIIAGRHGYIRDNQKMEKIVDEMCRGRNDESLDETIRQLGKAVDFLQDIRIRLKDRRKRASTLAQDGRRCGAVGDPTSEDSEAAFEAAANAELGY